MCLCIVICVVYVVYCCFFFFFQAEDGIRDLVRSRGLGDVYKRQVDGWEGQFMRGLRWHEIDMRQDSGRGDVVSKDNVCLLYTSDAADERSSVDLGGRRIIKKKNTCSVQV